MGIRKDPHHRFRTREITPGIIFDGINPHKSLEAFPAF
jgi:hypothetical protein